MTPARGATSVRSEGSTWPLLFTFSALPDVRPRGTTDVDQSFGEVYFFWFIFQVHLYIIGIISLINR